ncbi:inverse autotransporter beta domain-containing protein [Acerihabitans arboris]|uniref:inverse autotransporter beta domain-containing protein n=1 Tax=Acerihabitans arboris TaxID=2691583 RepID=UPI00139115CD|nr:inverse autotransporter beta domain-containing protein [Acerihabitans arboris]
MWIHLVLQSLLPLSLSFTPAVAASFYQSTEEASPPDITTPDNRLAGAAIAAGTLISSDNQSQSAANKARSALSSAANQSARDWLNQFGSARIQLNFNEHFRLDNSELDLLLPLYDNQATILFTQLGIRNKDSRNTGNIGAGIRTYRGAWMFGANSFFDNDFSGRNRRLGVGAEAWTDNLKLSANGYLGLTGWHQSRDVADYDERPANGFDLRAEAYLPSHPQLGGKLMFEQYHGDQVALFGKHSRQRNPYALTTGLTYTPIPLLTLGTEYRAGKGGERDANLNLQLNYRLGHSWRSQTDPALMTLDRSLAGGRHDLVERNNHIVLDYRRQEFIRLTLPDRLSGKSGQPVTLTAQVNATHGVDRIEWEYASLTNAGGRIGADAQHSLSLTLPPFQAAVGNNNSYSLSAVAYDSRGKASNRATTQVTVTGHAASAATSRMTAVPATLAADGRSTSRIVVNINDEFNQPVGGLADQLALSLNFTAQSGSAPGDGVAPPALGDIRETAPGEYSALFTAGDQPGAARVMSTIGGQELTDAVVTLTPAQGNQTFSLDKNSMVADNVDVATLTFTPRDDQGNAITGLGNRLAFTSSPSAGVGISAIAEDNGVYTAALKGTVAATVTVTPVVDGTSLTALNQTLVMNAGGMDAGRSAFTAEPKSIMNDNKAASTLTFTARDAYDNPVPGLDITFGVTGVAGTSLGTVAAANGVYTAQLTANTVGTATIVPLADGSPVGALSDSVTVIDTPIVFTVTTDRPTAKAGEVVQMTIEAQYASGAPVRDFNVDIRPTTAIGRTRPRREPITASINGASMYSGKTDNSGKITLAISDDDTIGLKTTYTVTPEAGAAVTREVIFSVTTSPDSEFAYYWGHMQDTVDGIKRPALRLEVDRPSAFYRQNNEQWVVMDNVGAESWCGTGKLPNAAALTGLHARHGSMSSAFGWPDKYYVTSSYAVKGADKYALMINLANGDTNIGLTPLEPQLVACAL